MELMNTLMSRDELLSIHKVFGSFRTFIFEELEDDDLDAIFSAIPSILERNSLSESDLYSRKNPHGQRKFQVSISELKMMHKGVLVVRHIGADDFKLRNAVNGAFRAFSQLYHRNGLNLPSPTLKC